MSRIGLIGTGHIAAPIARFLASKGHEIFVTERNQKVSESLKSQVGASVGSPQEVLDNSDIVFLCLRPHVAEGILIPLTFRADHQIISVMAGVPMRDLAAFCAPASDFAQFVPLGFLEQGGFPMAGFGNDRLLAELFEPENPVIGLKTEKALNAHMAVCATIPGMLDLLATSAEWLTDETGDAANADFYVAQLLAGFLSSMEKGGAGRLAAARDELATEGTYSLHTTNTLRAGRAHDALRTALTENNERMDT